MSLPERKPLPHDIPLWVDPSTEIYYLTVNCHVRCQNQLAHVAAAQALFETVTFRNARHIWYAYLFLVMPDHVHALLSFPPSGKPFHCIVSEWKGWTAKKLGINWQSDFFEHRLRHDESRRQKGDYILNNPVRAGLVQRPQDWPYVWFPASEKPESHC